MKTPCTDSNDATCACNYGYYMNTLSQQCEPCTMCPEGQGVLLSCELDHDTMCEECEEDTYSDQESLRDPCIPCTSCDDSEILRPCTSVTDTVCQGKTGHSYWCHDNGDDDHTFQIISDCTVCEPLQIMIYKCTLKYVSLSHEHTRKVIQDHKRSRKCHPSVDIPIRPSNIVIFGLCNCRPRSSSLVLDACHRAVSLGLASDCLKSEVEFGV